MIFLDDLPHWCCWKMALLPVGSPCWSNRHVFVFLASQLYDIIIIILWYDMGISYIYIQIFMRIYPHIIMRIYQSIPINYSKFQGWGWFLLSSSLCGAGTASASSSSSLSPLRQKIWELPAGFCTQLPSTLGKLSMGIFTSYQLGIWIKTT